MNLPFFYVENTATGTDTLVLDEDNSKHIAGVLRMPSGALLHLTDGRGNLLTAAITDSNKKKCRVAITKREETNPPTRKTAIAISLVKNPVRLEWFLEKATEIGISAIIPLICHRTERVHFRYDRMKNVLVSAMLQSRQTWLPVLQEPIKFSALLEQRFEQKFIAHCGGQEKKELDKALAEPAAGQLVLIGPEGDFTEEEIGLALQNGFVPVTLGKTRLRTETAGMVAAVLLQQAVNRHFPLL